MAKLIDITGKALSGEWGTDDETGGGIPVLRTTNFTNEGVVNYNDVVTRIITKKNIEEKYLRKGDIIIEKSGGSDKFPVGRVIYFDGQENTYLFNNFTGLLRVKNQDIWYSKYVFYSLFSNYKRGGTRGFENKTTGIHNLKIDDYVSRYEVAEIDKNEQVLICKKLDKFFGVIKLRKQELQLLDDLIKARFVEMFGDPIANEKEWEVTELNLACDGIGDGLHGTPEYDENGEYPFINGNNLMNGIIEITPTTKMVNETTYKKHYIELSRNAILLSINGTLGKLAFYNGEKVMLGKSACYCNLKSDFNREFVYGVMKTDTFMDFLENNATASTIKNVGLKAIRGFKLIMPPEELQTQFVEFANQVDKSKVAVQKALDEAQLLFDSLMQQYFG